MICFWNMTIKLLLLYMILLAMNSMNGTEGQTMLSEDKSKTDDVSDGEKDNDDSLPGQDITTRVFDDSESKETDENSPIFETITGLRCIKSHYDAYLRGLVHVMDGRLDTSLQCGKCEQWMINGHNGKVSLQESCTGMYLSAKTHSSVGLSEKILENEIRKPTKYGDGTWSFESVHGTHLRAQPNGHISLHTHANFDEKFRLESWTEAPTDQPTTTTIPSATSTTENPMNNLGKALNIFANIMKGTAIAVQKEKERTKNEPPKDLGSALNSVVNIMRGTVQAADSELSVDKETQEAHEEAMKEFGEEMHMLGRLLEGLGSPAQSEVHKASNDADVTIRPNGPDGMIHIPTDDDHSVFDVNQISLADESDTTVNPESEEDVDHESTGSDENNLPRNLISEVLGKRCIRTYLHWTYLRGWANETDWHVGTASRCGRCEQWTIEEQRGKVSLKESCTGKYLRSNIEWYVDLADNAKEHELWTPVKNWDGTWSLKSFHGTYLRAQPHGRISMQKEIGGDEKFRLELSMDTYTEPPVTTTTSVSTTTSTTEAPTTTTSCPSLISDTTTEMPATTCAPCTSTTTEQLDQPEYDVVEDSNIFAVGHILLLISLLLNVAMICVTIIASRKVAKRKNSPEVLEARELVETNDKMEEA